MLIRQRRASEAASSEITSEGLYLNRRTFISAATGAAVALTAGERLARAGTLPTAGATFANVKPGYAKLGEDDAVTPHESATTYNNYYEFAQGKDQPAKLARTFKPLPWKVAVGGLCAKPGSLDLDVFLQPHDLEERIYRLRCVEGWSMVIPWVGISLADVVKRFEPLGSAKYLRLETVHRPEELPGQRGDMLIWPYVEGLRLDEAVNPLAILAVGMYGKVLPGQSGAPIRLVVPWKYGFKSVKSIVRISFTEQAPHNTWAIKRPDEYGFYANVNPRVDHPRHTQATERRIGDGGTFFGLIEERRPTLMFNGYEEEVAHLYSGMDLRKSF
jgi:sulfoxide reductase catalytic subunit YedY